MVDLPSHGTLPSHISALFSRSCHRKGKPLRSAPARLLAQLNNQLDIRVQVILILKKDPTEAQLPTYTVYLNHPRVPRVVIPLLTISVSDTLPFTLALSLHNDPHVQLFICPGCCSLPVECSTTPSVKLLSNSRDRKHLPARER